MLDLRDTYEIGGPGKTILETYRAIDRTKFDLHLAVFLRRNETEDSPFISAARAIGMPVHIIRAVHQYDPRQGWSIADLARRLDADIIHAHEPKSDVLSFLASRQIDAVLMTTLHGWIGNSMKGKCFIELDRFVVSYFDCVIAVSEQIRQQVASRVPASKLRLIHNAIVLERYQRTGEKGFMAELLGRAVNGPVFSTIGRMSPEKGHADLLEAFAEISSTGVGPTLVLAGDGPDKSKLMTRAAELGIADRVHFPGYVARPERLLEETDLMVLPSHTEGLPNAALEAMAMGVPVLATRVGGTPEVVTDGETGTLVTPRAPRELSRAMTDFLSNPERWRAMAGRALGVVHERFNFTARTRKLEALYEELLESRPQ